MARQGWEGLFDARRVHGNDYSVKQAVFEVRRSQTGAELSDGTTAVALSKKKRSSCGPDARSSKNTKLVRA